MMTSKETYVTVAQAALWLGCSERTVRRWMSARLLTVYRRGNGTFVLELAELSRVERAQRQRQRTERARLKKEHVNALNDIASGNATST